MICGSNAAVSHRFIAEKEQKYIQNHIENKDREKVTRMMTLFIFATVHAVIQKNLKHPLVKINLLADGLDNVTYTTRNF